MKKPVQLSKAIDPIQNSLRPSPRRCRALIIPLAFGLACLAVSPTARAVDPPPDGGYPNQNTAEGEDALFSLTTGVNNTAMGFHALFANTAGSDNTATGLNALASNTGGNANTATGFNALFSNTTGFNNTATGLQALFSNTTGTGNTANGLNALENNTTGFSNTATGDTALRDNTTGAGNTANGVGALLLNTTGVSNTACGNSALAGNTDGFSNTASGLGALYANTIGNNNTATGASALEGNTTGKNNIALGASAGANLTTGNNNIDVGNLGVAAESAKIRIGTVGSHKNTYIAGIYGVTVSRGIGVIIDSTGHLGTTTSSARFKDQIKPMEEASEAILSLKPVTFRYKKELDPDGIPQFGLVAEQVAKVNPDLVARDEEGNPYTVRYDAVNAMLLNEFLKAHRRIDEQARQVKEQKATITELRSRAAKQEVAIAQQEKSFDATIAEQQKQIETLASSLQEQASQVQKVSARLAADQSAPRIVVNDQSSSR